MNPYNPFPYHLPDVGVSTIKIHSDVYGEPIRAAVNNAIRNALWDVRDIRVKGSHILPADFDWSIKGARLSKRVSAALYKNFGLKAENTLLGRIGEIASTQRDIVATYDLTNALDWHAGDFADRGSCYWGSYQHVRLNILPRFGAAALRIYEIDHDNPDGLSGNGRCWILPTNKVHGMFVSFNYYGACGTLDFTRAVFEAILNEQFGGKWQSKPVDLNVNTAYINAPQKYLFYPTDRTTPSGTPLSDKAQGISRLNYTTDQCNKIHWAMPKWVYNSTGHTVIAYCSNCSHSLYNATDITWVGSDPATPYCHDCADRITHTCSRCGTRGHRRQMILVDGGAYFCQDCAAIQTAEGHSLVYRCGTCNRWRLQGASPALRAQLPDAVTVQPGRWLRYANGNRTLICPSCANNNETCSECNSLYANGTLRDGRCPTCNSRGTPHLRVQIRVSTRERVPA